MPKSLSGGGFNVSGEFGEGLVQASGFGEGGDGGVHGGSSYRGCAGAKGDRECCGGEELSGCLSRRSAGLAGVEPCYQSAQWHLIGYRLGHVAVSDQQRTQSDAGVLDQMKGNLR